MLYYERIVVSQVIDVNEANAFKEWIHIYKELRFNKLSSTIIMMY